MDMLALYLQGTAWLRGYYVNLWILLLIISVVAAIYIFVDSNKRNIRNATFWRVIAIVNVVLFFPTIIIKINSDIAFSLSLEMLALFAYMGIASSIIAGGLAFGYWINFRELQFDSGQDFDPNIVAPPPPAYPAYPPMPAPAPAAPRVPQKPRQPKANAWLVMRSTGKNHQLNQGTTTIGRSTMSDIPILNDPTVSGTHIKIVEEHGHYKLVDLGSRNGTWVNGHRVRQPVLLDINDEIRLGDNTYLTFIAS